MTSSDNPGAPDKVGGHPTYPSPTVVEALCEIHFESEPGKGWEATSAGEVFKVVQADFPAMEPSVDVGFQLELGPHGFGQRLLPVQHRLRFKHARDPVVFQLSPNVLTVNLLPTYPGWVRARSTVVNLWSQVVAVLKPARVSRVGLRYINRVPRKSPDDRPRDWFRPSDLIPMRVLDSMPGYLLRLQAHLAPANRVVVTFGDHPADETVPHGAMVLDIDRIREGAFDVSASSIEQIADDLHEDIWRIFSDAKGPRLTSYLEGRHDG